MGHPVRGGVMRRLVDRLGNPRASLREHQSMGLDEMQRKSRKAVMPVLLFVFFQDAIQAIKEGKNFCRIVGNVLHRAAPYYNGFLLHRLFCGSMTVGVYYHLWIETHLYYKNVLISYHRLNERAA